MEVKSCRLKTGICLIVGHIFLDYLTIICIEKMQNNIQELQYVSFLLISRLLKLILGHNVL